MEAEAGGTRPGAGRAPSGPPAWMVLAAVLASAGIYAVMAGLTHPLLTLILRGRGSSDTLIGLNTAMMPLGFVVSSPLVPLLAASFGAARVALFTFALNGLLLLAIGATGTLLWFPLRFLLGFSVNCLFVISEAWINQLVDPRYRGRVMGLYATTISVGFAAGSFTVAITGVETWTPFLVGAAASWIAGPVLLLAWSALPPFPREAGASMLGFFSRAPLLIAAIGILAFFDQVVLSLFPLYGLSQGLGPAAAAAGVGVLVAGNAVLQVPIGWLADHMPRRRMMLICALATVLGSAALPAVVGSPLLLWPLLFCWGAFSFGVFTVAMAELGDRFSGAMLLAGNAAFAFTFGLGGIVGPPLVGAAMDGLGPQAYPALLGLSFALLAVLAASRQSADPAPRT